MEINDGVEFEPEPVPLVPIRSGFLVGPVLLCGSLSALLRQSVLEDCVLEDEGVQDVVVNKGEDVIGDLVVLERCDGAWDGAQSAAVWVDGPLKGDECRDCEGEDDEGAMELELGLVVGVCRFQELCRGAQPESVSDPLIDLGWFECDVFVLEVEYVVYAPLDVEIGACVVSLVFKSAWVLFVGEVVADGEVLGAVVEGPPVECEKGPLVWVEGD